MTRTFFMRNLPIFVEGLKKNLNLDMTVVLFEAILKPMTKILSTKSYSFKIILSKI